MQNPKLLLNCREYKIKWKVASALLPGCCLTCSCIVNYWADCDARMNEMTQGPGQGMIDTIHVIAEHRHGDTCHVARGILRSPATFYHEYIIFHSILIQWQLILYLYSSFKSRLLSAPSHTNDINITIYLADSAISIITNGDQADKYWYPPISGTNESRPPPPPPPALQLAAELSFTWSSIHWLWFPVLQVCGSEQICSTTSGPF